MTHIGAYKHEEKFVKYAKLLLQLTTCEEILNIILCRGIMQDVYY